MTRLQELERRNPEWRPWLGAIGEVFAAEDADWDGAVPGPVAPAGAPLLTSATIDLRAMALAPLLTRLMRAIGGSVPRVDEAYAREAFRAALNRDALAPEALRAAAALLTQPFLRACARRWRAELPRGWPHGYCPVCGAWAALAEICGVERVRHLRCGECGSAWRAHGLRCPYCGLADHADLRSLVAEGAPAKATLEVCGRCRGFLKAFSRLSGSPAREVMLEDLASVELDLVALERGYARPQGPGHRLHVQLA